MVSRARKRTALVHVRARARAGASRPCHEHLTPHSLLRCRRRRLWTSFKSSARKDGLALNHWQRASMEYTDYPYSRFNVRLDKVDYTDDEYDRYLQVNEWKWRSKGPLRREGGGGGEGGSGVDRARAGLACGRAPRATVSRSPALTDRC